MRVNNPGLYISGEMLTERTGCSGDADNLPVVPLRRALTRRRHWYGIIGSCPRAHPEVNDISPLLRIIGMDKPDILQGEFVRCILSNGGHQKIHRDFFSHWSRILSEWRWQACSSGSRGASAYCDNLSHILAVCLNQSKWKVFHNSATDSSAIEDTYLESIIERGNNKQKGGGFYRDTSNVWPIC